MHVLVFFPAPAPDASGFAARCRRLGLLCWLCCVPLFAAADARCTPAVPALRPVPVAAADEITVATQNLMRFFDDVDDGGAEAVTTPLYRLRLDKLARQVRDVLRHPDVLAVQEAENQKVLADLAAVLAQRGSGHRYQVALLEGHDRGGIDVGFLVRADWKIRKVEQLLARSRQDRAFLFDRPPLLLRLDTPRGALDLVNVHLKSLRGSDDRREAKRIARKRRRQAEALAGWLRLRLSDRSAPPLLVLGDFNAAARSAPQAARATTPAGDDVDVLGILEHAGLRRLDDRLAPGERWTYAYRCRAEALDHILASPGLVPDARRLAVSRGNAGVPARRAHEAGSAWRSSDHDGLVLYLKQ